MRKTLTVSLCASALCLYGASLLLPAFSCVHTKSFPGYGVLAFGYMGLLALDPRWFANIGFALLLIATLRSKPAVRPGVGGVTAMLALFSFAGAAGCEGGGGAPEVSTGLALGGYLWVSALALACAANFSVREHQATDFANTQPAERRQ
jgi:hypothetical protein